jgi:flagellin-like protein
VTGRRRSPTDTDRGVSEVLGYVMLFTMVVALIGLVYGAGTAELQDRRAASRLDNAERAFGILESNVDDIVYRDATSRSTTVAAAGGQVGIGDPVTFNLTLVDDGVSYSASVRPVVYHGADADVVYVNGAVVRAQPGGSAMLREPPMVFEEGTVVPYIRTRPQGARNVGGDTTVRIRTAAASRSAYVQPDRPTGDYRARLNVTTPRTGVWRRYLTTEAGASCTTTDGTVSCTFRTDRVAVSLVRIDVRLGT